MFSWTFFIIFAWEFWRILAEKSSMSPLVIFSFGSAFLTIFSLLGEALNSFAAFRGVGTMMLIAAICIATVLTSTFLLSDQKVREVVSDRAVPFDKNDSISCEWCVDQAAQQINLTEREREIALYVLQGKDNTYIATQLFISSATLYTHLRNMYKKSHVHSKQEFVTYLRSFL